MSARKGGQKVGLQAETEESNQGEESQTVRSPAEGRRRGEALSLPQHRHDLRGLCEKRGQIDGLKPTRETHWGLITAP